LAASPWQDIEVAAEEFAAEVASRLNTQGRAHPEAPEGPAPPEGLAASRATGARGRFAGLFGTAARDGSVQLRAVIARPGSLEVLNSAVPPAKGGEPAGYPALAPRVPAASWYEREVADIFGLVPEGTPHADPLVLPRNPQTRPPCPGPGGEPPRAPATPDESALTPHVSGLGVFTLPYGPVRSGIFEAVQYLIETPGEDIPHVRARVYHKHRGLERRFEGMTAADGALLAERVEGVASVAHAVAFCQAVERLGSGAGAVVPPGASLLRLVHLELERVANHVDSTLRQTEAAGQAVASSRLAWHKERLMRLRASLCGHRFGRGVVVPGGVSGPPCVPLSVATSALGQLARDLEADAHHLLATSSFVDRLRGTGVISAEVAEERGALGPVARASGSEEDLRTWRPYGAYGIVTVPAHRYRDTGDALARQLVRLEEIRGSFELCHLALEQLAELGPAGPWAADASLRDGLAWGWVEAPQGELLYMVEADGGRLARVKQRSASFHNLSLFPEAFGGDIFTDFAFIEASFGVSIAGVAG
jgi:Ni,Fe-hydrogenase III large subunit